jgi:hypothetical protein
MEKILKGRMRVKTKKSLKGRKRHSNKVKEDFKPREGF